MTFVGPIAFNVLHAVKKAMTFTTADVLLETVSVGDMIEFDRGVYSHYALYVGNGQVMNICAEDKNETTALICKMPLRQVCGDSPVKISNHENIALEHFRARSKAVDEILKNAEADEGRHVPYEFLLRNCEYYASKWRYGRGFSTQVANRKNQALELRYAVTVILETLGLAQTLDLSPYSEYQKIKN